MTDLPRPNGFEHTTSRSLRVMAVVRWVLLALVAALTAGTWWVLVIHPAAPKADGTPYQCPMHPQIQRDRPGDCPICFMKLEPIPEDRLVPDMLEAASPLPEPGEGASGLATVRLTLERRQAVSISTAPVTERDVTRELRLPAVLEVPEGAVSELRARVPAFVTRVAPVETGARVHAGDPLVWLDSTEFLAAQGELLAALRLTEAGASPSPDPLHGPGAVLPAARLRLRLLGLAEEDIDHVLVTKTPLAPVPLRAPSGGIVTARDVSPGTQATPQRALFQLTDLSHLWVRATVSVHDLPAGPAGLAAQLHLRGGGDPVPVADGLVEPRVHAESRTAVLRFRAPNPGGALLPGDIGELRLTLPPEHALLVPRDAVIDHGRENYAFVETAAGLFEPRIVRPGALVGEERVVLAGLAAGERVVERGAFVLDSESRLQSAVAPASPGSPAPPSNGATP